VKLTWPHVAIITVIVAGVVALAVVGRDTSALIALGTLLLAGIGLIAGQQSSLRDQNNGNMSKVLSTLEGQGQLLAQMQPPPPVAVAVEQPPVEGDRPPNM
jgi:hypothetical protein